MTTKKTTPSYSSSIKLFDGCLAQEGGEMLLCDIEMCTGRNTEFDAIVEFNVENKTIAHLKLTKDEVDAFCAALKSLSNTRQSIGGE